MAHGTPVIQSAIQSAICNLKSAIQMRILFAGIIARYPFGGVTWCSLMYLLGLRALGHDVFYIEDTGECVYDPIQNTRAVDPSYGTNYIHQRPRAAWARGSLELRQLRRQLPRADGRRGPTLRARARISSSTSPAVRGSGVTSTRRIPRKIFIDSDPAFTQLAIAKAEPWYVEFFRRFDRLFTFGANIGTHRVVHSGRRFHLEQDLAADHDRRLAHDVDAARSLHDGHDLADRKLRRRRRQQGSGISARHRHAVADDAEVRAGNQRTADSCCASTAGTPWTRCRCRERREAYRDFIHGSKAEFGVAKHTYVASRSGWFSDRTECYLAAGRPALVQDTGWTAHLPSGEGLVGVLHARRSRSPASIASTPTMHCTRGARMRSRATISTPVRCCRVCSTRPSHDDFFTNRPHRPGCDYHSPAEVWLGGDDDVSSHRGSRRARTQGHTLRDR